MAELDPYQHFIKKGDQTIKRLRLQFVDIDGSLCDSCNMTKPCAIIQDIQGVSHHICLDCLNLITTETKKMIEYSDQLA